MRRGVQDAFFLGMLIIVLIITGFVVYYALSQSTTAFSNAFGNDNFTQMMQGVVTAEVNFVNALPVGLILGGIIAIALASMIPSNPVFLPLGIIMLIASVVVFVFLQDSLTSILQTDFFQPLTLVFPLPTAILEHIALIVGAIGIAILAVTYGRVQRFFGGGAPDQ